MFAIKELYARGRTARNVWFGCSRKINRSIRLPNSLACTHIPPFRSGCRSKFFEMLPTPIVRRPTSHRYFYADCVTCDIRRGIQPRSFKETFYFSIFLMKRHSRDYLPWRLGRCNTATWVPSEFTTEGPFSLALVTAA